MHLALFSVLFRMEELVLWHFSRFEPDLWLHLTVLLFVLLFLATQLCGQHEWVHAHNSPASRVLLAVAQANFEGGLLKQLAVKFSCLKISRLLIVFQIFVQSAFSKLGVGAGEVEFFKRGRSLTLDLRQFACMLEQVRIDGARLKIARAVFNGAVFAEVVEVFS